MSFIWATWCLKLFSDLLVNFQKLGHFIYKSRFYPSSRNLKDLAALDLYLSMTTQSRGARSLQIPLGEPYSGSPRFHEPTWCDFWLLQLSDEIPFSSWLNGYLVRRGVDVISGALESGTSINNSCCRRQSPANIKSTAVCNLEMQQAASNMVTFFPPEVF